MRKSKALSKFTNEVPSAPKSAISDE